MSLSSLHPGNALADASTSQGNIRIEKLLCEHQESPVGVGTSRPALSWVLGSSERSQYQKAYHILAATSEEKLDAGKADLWDSGKVVSNQSILVSYDGKSLGNNQQVFWTVQVWDSNDVGSGWAKPTSFVTGILDPSGWTAKWIGSGEPLIEENNPLEKADWIWHAEDVPDQAIPDIPAGTTRYFRKVLHLPVRTTTARLTITADNVAKIFLNGQSVGMVDNHKTARVYEIADHLTQGTNILAVDVKNLGNKPNPAGLIAAVELQDETGTSYSIVTDDSWKSSVHPDSDWTTSETMGWPAVRELGKYGIKPWDEPSLDGTHKPLPIFRREIDIRKPLRRAYVNICGLGHHDLYLDGKLAVDEYLDPPWSQYEKTVYYSTHDLTELLTPGKHALGVMLGKGFWHTKGNRRIHGLTFNRPLSLILQLNLEYADGSRDTIISDENWKWLPGPITHNAIVGGSDYDARRLPADWASPGADEQAWKPVQPGNPSVGQLKARISPPLTTHEEFKPKSIEEVEPGVFVYDFGQNASATPRLKVSGPAGAVIHIIYAEQRHGSTGQKNDGKGRIDQAGLGTPAYYEYVCRGGGEEEWFPRFYYTGYQYMEFSGAVPEGFPNPNNLPVIKELTSVHIRSSAATIGSFECSNELFNSIDTMVDWAIRSNLSHVLTDCPHREKLGWLEVPHLMWDSLAFRYDLPGFGAKVSQDTDDSQTTAGRIPTVAPHFAEFHGGFDYTPEWGAAGVFIPWYTYQWYGDKRVVEKHFESMRMYVEYMLSTAKDYVPAPGLGDWYDYGHGKDPGISQFTPVELTAMATFHDCTRVVAKAAALFNKPEEQKKYESLASEIKKSYNARFFNGKDEYKNNGSPQTANAISLVCGLVPDDKTTAVVNRLIEDLEKRNYQQTSGDVGFHYFIRALADNGRSDILFRNINRRELGSYGYLVDGGWSSLPEAWDAHRRSSMNHCMLGHIHEWFQGSLGGIRPDKQSAAFKRFIIDPEMVGDIISADSHHISPYGRIVCNWKKEVELVELNITVPTNTTARIYIPGDDETRITEGNTPVSESKGIKIIGRENGKVVLEAGSGNYVLRSH